MRAARRLIVNADDFGQSPGVNRGIIEAHEHGIVTSASLMVRWPAALEAAAYGRAHPAFALGLHLDLGEWVYRDDRWVALYEVVDLDDEPTMAREVLRQLERFRELVGREPTHIDSHQHVHLREAAHVASAVARTLGVPLRQCSSDVVYCGRFYGQTAEGLPYPDGIEVTRLLEIIADLPAGWTELGCHPGDGTDFETMYRTERRREVRALCDPRVREAIVTAGIELRSFHDIAARREPGRVPPARPSAAQTAREL